MVITSSHFSNFCKFGFADYQFGKPGLELIKVSQVLNLQ